MQGNYRRVITNTKGFDAEQIAKTFAQSFFYIEVANYNFGESLVDAGPTLKDDFLKLEQRTACKKLAKIIFDFELRD